MLNPSILSPAFAHPSLCIQTSHNKGRSVVTNTAISAGTPLLTSSDLVTFTLNREHRREVCGQCFAYNRGITWPLKDRRTGIGIVWCRDACEAAWRDRYKDEDVLAAMAAVEGLLARAKGHKGDSDVLMFDAPNEAPTEDRIAQVWSEAEEVGRSIITGRCSVARSKAQRRIMRETIAEAPTPGLLTYSLSAVLAAKLEPELWASMLELEAAPRPYHYAATLAHHTSAYLQLLCILPLSLIDYCTPAVLLASADRDMRNSFGLRSLDDEGSEMFGYGTWPSASYWNHSCEPNVEKRREGRSWHFHASRDINAGEELCITYLGGCEEICGIEERRKRLQDTWAFECACVKCTRDAGG